MYLGRKLFLKHLAFWKDKTIRYHVVLSLVLLGLSIAFTYFAKLYTSVNSIGDPIPDLLLDHIPVMNVNFIFFQGAFLFVVAFTAILLYEPKRIPFSVVSTALFFTIRSIFTVMTHLVPPGSATYQYVDYEHHIKQVVFTVSSGNDLFFSGHAGYPFLLALIFWKLPKLRYFFIICTVVASFAVIAGHLHYSIDVFSAFFISFGIFEISKKIFKKEHALYEKES